LATTVTSASPTAIAGEVVRLIEEGKLATVLDQVPEQLKLLESISKSLQRSEKGNTTNEQSKHE
jgi:hypothetical protein